MALINRLVEELGVPVNDAAKLVDLENLEALSGGRNGSASKLIGLLLDMQREIPRPPTERQVKYLNDLLGKGVENLEDFEILPFLGEYSVSTVDEMTFAQISDAIQIMKDRLGIKGRGRRRKGSG